MNDLLDYTFWASQTKNCFSHETHEIYYRSSAFLISIEMHTSYSHNCHTRTDHALCMYKCICDACVHPGASIPLLARAFSECLLAFAQAFPDGGAKEHEFGTSVRVNIRKVVLGFQGMLDWLGSVFALRPNRSHARMCALMRDTLDAINQMIGISGRPTP